MSLTYWARRECDAMATVGLDLRPGVTLAVVSGDTGGTFRFNQAGALGWRGD